MNNLSSMSRLADILSNMTTQTHVSNRVQQELIKLEKLDKYWYNTLERKIRTQGSLDLHCWMKNRKTNEIIEVTPEEPHIDLIMQLHSCSSKERKYEEIENFEVKQIIHKIVYYMFVSKELKSNQLEKYDKNPVYCRCFLNVFSKKMCNDEFKTNKDIVFCYGKMGFEKHDGSIHWEYG